MPVFLSELSWTWRCKVPPNHIYVTYLKSLTHWRCIFMAASHRYTIYIHRGRTKNSLDRILLVRYKIIFWHIAKVAYVCYAKIITLQSIPVCHKPTLIVLGNMLRFARRYDHSGNDRKRWVSTEFIMCCLTDQLNSHSWNSGCGQHNYPATFT